MNARSVATTVRLIGARCRACTFNGRLADHDIDRVLYAASVLARR